jgi:transposase
MGKYKSYSKEFKLEAVRLLESSGKPGAEIARELGIRRNQLYKWQEQMNTKGKEGVFPGHGRRAGREAEMARLQC